ncbi:MAG TPA: laccase domain-containing protein [Candidatus Saccharibacteria bacterium]|nr:laccase domain-containing protein [Candidatus Saccharibacteria bacterium]
MKLVTALSTVADGDMGFKSGTDTKTRNDNIKSFLDTYRISIDDTTRVAVTYNTNDFCRYREVGTQDKNLGMLDGDINPADALVTRQPNHALFLPLADCVGMVVFDPHKHILMLSHIGRHSLEQDGAYRSIKFLVDNYQSDPNILQVRLTPAPGKDNYPLFAFDNHDFKDVVFEQLKTAGIISSNIINDSTDTTSDGRFYSHSEFLKGNQKNDGRYAIVTMMR